MSTKLTREVYEQLVREDLEWLMKQPDTLERHHIEAILGETVDFYYPKEEKKNVVVHPNPAVSRTTVEWSEPLRPKWRDTDRGYDHLEYQDRDY